MMVTSRVGVVMAMLAAGLILVTCSPIQQQPMTPRRQTREVPQCQAISHNIDITEPPFVDECGTTFHNVNVSGVILKNATCPDSCTGVPSTDIFPDMHLVLYCTPRTNIG